MKVESYKLFLDVASGKISPEDAQIELLELIKRTDAENPRVFMGDKMLKCPLGVYEIFWSSGGSSVASIGMTYSGKRWIAPTNWTNGSDDADPTGRLEKHFESIEKIVLLYE